MVWKIFLFQSHFAANLLKFGGKHFQSQNRTLASSKTISIGKNIKKNVPIQHFELIIFFPYYNFGQKNWKFSFFEEIILFYQFQKRYYKWTYYKWNTGHNFRTFMVEIAVLIDDSLKVLLQWTISLDFSFTKLQIHAKRIQHQERLLFRDTGFEFSVEIVQSFS